MGSADAAEPAKPAEAAGSQAVAQATVPGNRGGLHDNVGPVCVPTVFGRQVRVPRAVGGACRFTFDELCAGRSDMGAADFQAICEHFHTVAIDGIPFLSATE